MRKDVIFSSPLSGVEAEAERTSEWLRNRKRAWKCFRWLLLFSALLLVLGLVVYYLLIDVQVGAKVTTTITEDAEDKYRPTSVEPVWLHFNTESDLPVSITRDFIEIVDAPDLGPPTPTEPDRSYQRDEEIMMTSDRDPTRRPVSLTLPPSAPQKTSHDVRATDNETESTCFSTHLEMCKGILPYDLTTLPHVPGIHGLKDLDAALPYFEMILESKCSQRARQFLCSLLEPACQPSGDAILLPCRKACRAVAEECSDFMLLSLDLSKIFNCNEYPDLEDPAHCVNFAKGEVCLDDEYRCPEGSCIPKRWRCDDVNDCSLAADEANCSRCSDQEIKCEVDNKCIPLKWRCDGNKDCTDGSDEVRCPIRESSGQPHTSPCPVGELRCLDGRCITMQQLCDGVYDCSDGADEANCGAKPGF